MSNFASVGYERGESGQPTICLIGTTGNSLKCLISRDISDDICPIASIFLFFLFLARILLLYTLVRNPGFGFVHFTEYLLPKGGIDKIRRIDNVLQQYNMKRIMDFYNQALLPRQSAPRQVNINTNVNLDKMEGGGNLSLPDRYSISFLKSRSRKIARLNSRSCELACVNTTAVNTTTTNRYRNAPLLRLLT